ncbi:MAG: hypothetical protein L3J39_13225 [Verrucomicrobiales bacterium]|nr:hypothetical protein [Verrucomicrobiales bacterium]
MQYNQFLENALAWLFLILPACLVVIKLAYPKISWLLLYFITATFSWIVCYGLLWTSPAENGFGNAVILAIGWVFMLPILAISSLLSLPARRWIGSTKIKLLALGLWMLALILPISACFRWIPESRAIDLARLKLQSSGISKFEIYQAERTWEGWIIHIKTPQQNDYPVYLSRSGFISGIGG